MLNLSSIFPFKRAHSIKNTAELYLVDEYTDISIDIDIRNFCNYMAEFVLDFQDFKFFNYYSDTFIIHVTNTSIFFADKNTTPCVAIDMPFSLQKFVELYELCLNYFDQTYSNLTQETLDNLKTKINNLEIFQ